MGQVAGYSGQGCMCSLEQMTFPSLISSVMVRIWVPTWEAEVQGMLETQGTLLEGLLSVAQGWAGSLRK